MSPALFGQPVNGTAVWMTVGAVDFKSGNAKSVLAKSVYILPLYVEMGMGAKGGPEARRKPICPQPFDPSAWSWLVNDIALVELAEPLPEFNEFIQPICLPKTYREEVERGHKAAIAGWGLTKRESS